MKMFKATMATGVMLALVMRSIAAQGVADPKVLETNLAWAQMMAEAPTGGGGDAAWGSYWRNEAGHFASELTLAQLDKNPALQAAPAAPVDPNARFRAAPTPEENLARVPAPKLTTENDYVPKLRPGETASVTVDYARIESMISRPPAEPASTATVIPPVMGYGMAAPYMGYGWSAPGWGGWGGGAWGGRSGWWAGRRDYWSPPCVIASPVYYDPYCGGGISGGFFYRSRHFGIGVRF